MGHCRGSGSKRGGAGVKQLHTHEGHDTETPSFQHHGIGIPKFHTIYQGHSAEPPSFHRRGVGFVTQCKHAALWCYFASPRCCRDKIQTGINLIHTSVNFNQISSSLWTYKQSI